MVRTGKSLQCLNHSSLSSCLFSVHLEAKQRSGGCRNEPSAVSPPAPVWSATVFSWEGRDGSIAVSSQIPVAAAAKSLQSCPTLCDPIDGSPPGSPSLGFSRQEHWSGLPLPSPVHESEKWKWSRSVRSDSLRPHGLQPTRLLHPWDFPGKSTGVGCRCLLRRYLLQSLRFKQVQGRGGYSVL